MSNDDVPFVPEEQRWTYDYLTKLVIYVDDLFQKRLQAYLLAHSIFFAVAVATVSGSNYVPWFSIALGLLGLCLVWHQLFMTLRLRFRLNWLNATLAKRLGPYKSYLKQPQKGRFEASCWAKCLAKALLRKKRHWLLDSGWLSTYGLAILTFGAWTCLLVLAIVRCATM